MWQMMVMTGVVLGVRPVRPLLGLGLDPFAAGLRGVFGAQQKKIAVRRTSDRVGLETGLRSTITTVPGT